MTLPHSVPCEGHLTAEDCQRNADACQHEADRALEAVVRHRDLGHLEAAAWWSHHWHHLLDHRQFWLGQAERLTAAPTPDDIASIPGNPLEADMR